MQSPLYESMDWGCEASTFDGPRLLPAPELGNEHSGKDQSDARRKDRRDRNRCNEFSRPAHFEWHSEGPGGRSQQAYGEYLSRNQVLEGVPLRVYSHQDDVHGVAIASVSLDYAERRAPDRRSEREKQFGLEALRQ